MTKKFKHILSFFCFFVASFFIASQVKALDVGTNEISNTIALSSASPLQMAARIINIFMLSLGVIAVSLVIFAGFKWMTSGGNEEKIEVAKKTLKNAVIGLVIILSSWGITTFILNRLIGATGNQGGFFSNVDSGGGAGLGYGALGACTVESVYPEPDQKDVPRNTSIIITFKEDLKMDTVCVDAGNNPCICDNTSNCNKLNTGNIKIYETGNNASTTEAIVAYPTGNNKTLLITPVLPLGSPVSDTWYITYFSNDVSKADGSPMFSTCSTDYFQWQFKVSNKLDLIPPLVLKNGVFPEPDSLHDQVNTNSVLSSAVGAFKVLAIPKAYIAPQIDSIEKYPSGGSWNPATASLDANYGENEDAIFNVTVMAGDKAQLYRSSAPLGVANFNDNIVSFPGYFTLTIGGDGSKQIGNAWKLEISAAQKADNIMVGADTYAFVSGGSNGYNIEIANNPDNQALRIATALSGRLDVLSSASNNNVNIEAKVAGFAGNSINLSTNNYNVFGVIPMSGGMDEEQVSIIKDKKDKPMNSVIQINFNEAVNPITSSGNAGDVSDSIRIINANASLLNGALCGQDSDCRSYKCDSGVCLGDYLDGKFEISNGYKTLEFRTNNECGMNGCGEKIYCLPSDSNLRVEIMAANLVSCASDTDCSSRSPYSSCVDNSGVFMACQDENGINHPAASLSPMRGIMDASFNSLDGNRNGNSEGPISYYDENIKNENYKDNYRWSFFISNKIDATPPKISLIVPGSETSSIDLSNPIIITFDKLMMNSTLRSGSVKVKNGEDTVEHKLLNLRNSADAPTGFWPISENLDYSPLDGQPDITRVQVSHSMFEEAINYFPQVGSGVKDIYQNCFKPSSGPSCVASQDNPSCCNGSAQSVLNNEGNCPNN